MIPSGIISYTKKLFLKKYKYKIIIRFDYALLFRHNYKRDLNAYITKGIKPTSLKYYRTNLDEISAKSLVINLRDMLIDQDVTKRVEGMYLSIYTNDIALLNNLYGLAPSLVTNVYMPPEHVAELLTATNIIANNAQQFMYRVNLYNNKVPMNGFLEWCEGNDKIYLSSSIKWHFSRNRGTGEPWIYVADDNTLMITRLYLGELVKQVLTIIHI